MAAWSRVVINENNVSRPKPLLQVPQALAAETSGPVATWTGTKRPASEISISPVIKEPPRDPKEVQAINWARRELKAAIVNAWKAPNIQEAIAVFSTMSGQTGPSTEAKHKVLDLLEIPLLRNLEPCQYAGAVGLAGHFRAELDPRYYAKLLVLLTSQIPVNTSLVRLTLNMSLPPDGDVVELVDSTPPPAPAAPEEPVVKNWRAANFIDKFGGIITGDETDEDWREKAIEASLAANKKGVCWRDPPSKKNKHYQPEQDQSFEEEGWGDTVPIYWLTLGATSPIVLQGYPSEVPALLHSKTQKVFSSASNILGSLVNDIEAEVSIEHDPTWKLFPDVREALVRAEADDIAFAVAKCPALGKWAVGIAAGHKTRETAAKLALCLAITKGPAASALRQTIVAHYPEYGPLAERAEPCGAAIGASRSTTDVLEVGEQTEANLITAIVNPADVRGTVKTEDALVARYYGHFTTLLHLETLVELRDMQERLNRNPKELVKHGWTVQGLRVREFNVNAQTKQKNALPGMHNQTKKKVKITFHTAQGTDWSKVRFRPGDWVALSRTNPLEDMSGEGLVHAVPASDDDGPFRSMAHWNDGLVIIVDTELDDAAAREGVWRVDKGANRTAYERQMLALMKLAQASKSSRPSIWNALLVSGVGGQNTDSWATKSRDSGVLTAGTEAASALDAQLGSSLEAQIELLRLSCEEPALSEEGKQQLVAVQAALTSGEMVPMMPDLTLNSSQRMACAAALGRRLTLIQGPPGTGKTHVSVCLLNLWAKGVPECWPLLATSGSNIAVDNIAEGCIRAGLKVVRIGRPEKVSPQLEACTLEHLLRARGDQHVDFSSAGFFGMSAEDSEKERRSLDHGEKMKILKHADVICATTIVAGSDFLSPIDFGACLIDEVAQATEIAALVPIIHRSPGQLALVGDHCQLPPTTSSREAEKRGMTLSMFGRLNAHGLQPFFLDTQFRMHPKICEFSAREFYEGKLKTGITSADRPAPLGFQWPHAECGVAFINCDGFEHREGESYVNHEEAGIVADILQGVLSVGGVTFGGISVLEVGVVSPYAAQVKSMRQYLRQEMQTRLPGCDLTGGLQGKRANHALEIASVDAFQGREKDLIIFSAVRSNWKGTVGFLADWRRLNVMLTRARRGIIVIGNAQTLRSDPIWARWIDWAKQSKLVANGYGNNYNWKQSRQSGWSNHSESWPAQSGMAGAAPQDPMMAAFATTMAILSGSWQNNGNMPAGNQNWSQW